MNYGAILSKLRKQHKYSQPYVAKYLNRHSSKAYAPAMISHWENGVALPPVEQFLLMCELYGITDIQKTFRGVDTGIPNYDRLNSTGKERADEYILMLNQNSLFYDDTSSIVSEPIMRSLRLYDLPASAGTGNYLDSESYTEIEVDEAVAGNADLAVRISGDSMEPRFKDGQYAYIKEQETLNIGDIGLFAFNNESLLKELGENELISLNPKYKPMDFNEEFDSIRVFGKVIN
jgi:SOS-response transcriptional repressor LexA